ncbi:MAG TPA: hypothetical protein VE931_01590 [Pyrinomonadaceae bacterium]|nr:hypothetical protein [Pyrinomonadaceae bacterium]
MQVKPRSMIGWVVFSFDLHNRDRVKPFELLISFATYLLTSLTITSNSDALTLCSVADITEPSAVAPGQSLPAFVLGEIDPALPRSVLLSSEQLAFDRSNLDVNHAKAVQHETRVDLTFATFHLHKQKQFDTNQEP